MRRRPSRRSVSAFSNLLASELGWTLPECGERDRGLLLCFREEPKGLHQPGLKVVEFVGAIVWQSDEF